MKRRIEFTGWVEIDDDTLDDAPGTPEEVVRDELQAWLDNISMAGSGWVMTGRYEVQTEAGTVHSD